MSNVFLKKVLYLPICFLLLILSWNLEASTTGTDKPYEMPSIVVVGTPIIEGNDVDAYAGQKTTVTEQQMDDLNAQDLSTALRKTPGVNITRYNPIGSFGGASGGAVFIRGMGSSRPGAEIKMLIDGIPMYMSIWNHPLLDLMSIDPAQSIEVYKSPQPYIFGNAFAVINIVPKEKRDDGFRSRLRLEGGSFRTGIATLDHGGKLNDLDYYLSGGYRTSDGHRTDANGELKDAYGRVGYRFSPNWKLSAFSLGNDNSASDPGKEGAPSTSKAGYYETNSWMNVVTLENRYDTASGFVKLYRNSGEGNWLNQPTTKSGVRENLYNNFLFYGAKAKETFHFWKGGEVLTGLDWDVTDGHYDDLYTNGTTNSWAGHHFTIVSPYAAVNHTFGNKDGFYWTPSAGARYYDNSDFDSEWSPHAGMVFGYRQTELHAGYARGVIYPGLDVVVVSEKVNPALKTSWKNLKPELVDHYEIGISHTFGQLAIAELTWFYDDGKDRYIIVPPPPPPPVWSNIESYRIQGVEASISIHPTSDLSLFAGITLLDPEPSDLPYAPKVTYSAGMNWRFLDAFKLSLDCQYVDDMYVDSQARRLNATNTQEVSDYFLLNGKIGYHFPWNGNQSEIFLAVENITDTSYEYLPGYPMPGINAMLGIQLMF
ncbi:MAG: TonB-dependent receptor plug domain-containing protein [Thermodesulfobacteriota bacterium]